MNNLQEKFQTILPIAPGDDDNGEWVWPFRGNPKVRDTGEAGNEHCVSKTAIDECDRKLNFLPPGMEISNQERKRIDNMPLSMAGASDVSGQENFKGDKIFEKGFHRQDMRGCDDQYTAEHVDHFYGAVVDHDGDGKTYEGFAERNNYLDRI